MSDQLFLLIIIALGISIPIIGGLVFEYHKRKLALAERPAGSGARAERLEERMGVLERIVTDPALDVSIEIEKLRDQPTLRNARAD